MVDLAHHWPEPLAGHTPLRERLLAAYDEPRRGYHNRQHLAEVFARVDTILAAGSHDIDLEKGPDGVDRDAVLLAAWFHDAVYDEHGDNEERSAVLAEHELSQAGLPGALVDEVVRLVRLTATHQAGPDDPAGQVLCDADLGILAADEGRYEQYTAGVRQEYAHITDHDFRHGRAQVLRGLLDRSQLFSTDFARRRWEAAARANIAGELQRLASPAG